MARFPGAVTAITTAESTVPLGFIATAVCSLSADPPSVIVCVNKSASAHDVILHQGFFAVNILASEHAQVVRQFGEKKGAERFAGIDWRMGETGAPLLTDARVALDCTLAKAHDGFSHTILVGVVQSILMPDEANGHCLLWQGRSFHKAIELALT
ncbi:flavin reductase family protein [Burkholderia sp. Ac-20379]|nr:flavin reductase family protein [Burkholderia sp. Ac-20379]MBN3725352.1 flavin reductase family protein [Burkholderia sp. Ac-20379]